MLLDSERYSLKLILVVISNMFDLNKTLPLDIVKSKSGKVVLKLMISANPSKGIFSSIYIQ